MTAINPQARSFVNLIVSGYDSFCHKDIPNVPDIFNSGLEDLKESSLTLYAERFSNPPLVEKSGPPQEEMTDAQLEEDAVTKPPQVEKSNPPVPMTYAELDADVVAKYKESAPTLSHLFALTGMLDAPLQDRGLQKTQLRIIEALAQDHLRNTKGYELDPMASVMHSLSASQAVMQGESEPLPQFVDGKKRFYAQIFQEVFSKCNIKSKKEIIEQLQHFEPVLNTRDAQFQREVFKVERTFNDHFTDERVKCGVSIAVGVVSYFAVNKTIALAGQLFASPIFISFSTAVVGRMPAVVVQISSGAYTRIADVVAYVVNTRIYVYLFHSGKLVPFMITKLLPLTSWIFYPVSTFANHVFGICYQRAFGPDALVQMAISKKLEAKVLKGKCDAVEAEELLDGGMKAYQIWMYLVEQGPQRGLFEATK